MQWLTGWQYQTFVAYHRHTARVMFYLVVIHAVLFTVALADYYSTDVKETYLIWGYHCYHCRRYNSCSSYAFSEDVGTKSFYLFTLF